MSGVLKVCALGVLVVFAVTVNVVYITWLRGGCR
jgi:hypothetical protein